MEEEDDQKVCQNCQQKFPSFKIDLHEAYCRRNIRRCKICSKMVDINDQESHHNQFHVEQPCQYCHSSIPVTQLSAHKEQCSERPIECKHCQNPFPFLIIPRHENQCGSRTRKCQTCKKYVKINVYEDHAANCRIIQIPRNESQEQRRMQEHIGFHERVNSNQHIKKEVIQAQSPRLINRQLTKPNIIGREPISQLVDPVPISVRITMQKEKEKIKRK